MRNSQVHTSANMRQYKQVTGWHLHSSVFAPVMTGGKQVDLWVCSQNPEAIVLAAESLRACALGHVPHANALVFRVGYDDVLHACVTC